MAAGLREIVWATGDDPGAVWGARYQGKLGPIDDARQLLFIPPFKGPPRPIGVTLWKDERRALVVPPALVGNSDVRARVTYSAGASGSLVFECDWRGSFVVNANQISVEWVTFRPDATRDFALFDRVTLAATAAIDGVSHGQGATYTVAPVEVEPEASFHLEHPLLATRVSLLLRYDYAPGGSGTAPLGQVILTFNTASGTPLAWIDASSSRDAAFGGGLVLPSGSSYLALSNKTPAPIQVGAVYLLGV